MTLRSFLGRDTCRQEEDLQVSYRLLMRGLGRQGTRLEVSRPAADPTESRLKCYGSLIVRKNGNWSQHQTDQILKKFTTALSNKCR